ncbi:MAG: DUF1320 domain-containing protein [Pseudomonadota bacterium]|nr:DUF1320 domain-containing protein [Pseudomonadota bacterium]
MRYVSRTQLAESPGALELAQLASDPTRPVLEAALVDAVLRGADASGWEVEDVDHALAAVARIDEAVEDADGYINGFLSRAGYRVPLSPVPRIVTGWSRDIARYRLHKDRITDERTDPVARAYRDAERLLRLLVEGKFSLGINDPESPVHGGGMPRVQADERVWSRENLKDFAS